jgi:hypothetical protein
MRIGIIVNNVHTILDTLQKKIKKINKKKKIKKLNK